MALPPAPKLTGGEAEGTSWSDWAAAVNDELNGAGPDAGFTDAQRATLATTYLPLVTANSDHSLNLPDTGWGIATDGSPTYYGIGQVPPGQRAYGPTFTTDGSAVLVLTGA